MRKILVALILVSSMGLNAQSYKSKSSKVSFYSHAPLEDIYAETNSTISEFRLKDSAIAVIIKIKSFVFEKPLMQEHFNDNYLESDKFPKAIFKGKIKGSFDLLKDGSYPIEIVGEINIHGVKKPRTLKATFVIKDGKVHLEGKFNVSLKDHNIEIPSMVTKKIAETVEVTVGIDYKLKPKK